MVFGRRTTKQCGDDLDESIRPRELTHMRVRPSEGSGAGPRTSEVDASPLAGAAEDGAEAMTRATTMLEMCELRDMVRLGEEMTPGPGQRSSSRNDDDDDDDSCFYIDDDSSDYPLDDDDDGADAFSGVVQEDAKCDFRSGGHVGAMRRSKSLASLTASHRLGMIDFSHAIATSEVDDGEEKTREDHIGEEEHCFTSCLPPVGEESCVPLNDFVAKSNHSQLTDSSHSMEVVPPRGMPLRSNLKSSNNNFDNLVDGSQRSANSAASSGMKRNVSFSSLEIRSYDITLGDAPTVNGPPISLDWKYDPAETRRCSIDAYENETNDDARECTRRLRRDRQELLMPSSHRQYLLMREWGFSRGEIEGAMKEARRASQRRARTVRNARNGFDLLEESFETVRKKVASVGRSIKRTS
ncbi:hypothetical protein ACHAW5_000349 [Stephanodiscus triporus]|uniref:Uncharacterized protein n=1 Tax=Stephanodiscus triporus TaxID=2934178 RepID=A0ABD3MP74_9STRA